MRISQAALIVALVVAPVASAAAGTVVLPAPAPLVFPHGLGERHAFWRGGEADHDVWRHYHRQEFFGPLGGGVGEAVEPGPEPAPVVVSAPVFVSVTFTPAGASPRGWLDGPKIIEIGQSAPPRRHLPLVIYGD